MRPVGEISAALLQAAQQLVTPERAPTLRELAHHAQVGEAAALNTVKNLTRSGKLRRARDERGAIRTRRVDHCNKPVAEYEPVLLDIDHRAGEGWVDLGRIVGGWAR